MNKTYKKLVKVLNDNNLTKVSFTEKDKTYLVERMVSVSNISNTGMTSITGVAPELESIIDGTAVKAPIVGSFYNSPSPGKKAFVKKGDKVAKGQIIFILEAMKVMNEIKAPVSGIIKEINYNDGDLVEFDEIIMVIG